MPTPIEVIGLQLAVDIGDSEAKMDAYNAAVDEVVAAIEQASRASIKLPDVPDVGRLGAAQLTAQVESQVAQYQLLRTEQKGVIEAYRELGYTGEQAARVLGISTQQLAERMQNLGYTTYEVQTFFVGGVQAMYDYDAAARRTAQALDALVTRTTDIGNQIAATQSALAAATQAHVLHEAGLRSDQEAAEALAKAYAELARLQMMSAAQAGKAGELALRGFIDAGYQGEEVARMMGISTQQLAEKMRQAGIAVDQVRGFFAGGTAAMFDYAAAQRQAERAAAALAAQSSDVGEQIIVVQTSLERATQAQADFTAGLISEQEAAKAVAESYAEIARLKMVAFEQRSKESALAMQGFIDAGYRGEQVAQMLGISTQQLTQRMLNLGFTVDQVRTFFDGGTSAMYNFDAAQRQADRSASMLVKRLATLVIGTGTIYYATLRLRNEIASTVKDLYGQSEAYKELAESARYAEYSLVAALLPYQEFSNVTGLLTQSLTAFGQVMTILGADIYAYIAGMRELYESLSILDVAYRVLIGDSVTLLDVTEGLAGAQRLFAGEVDLHATMIEEFKRRVQESVEAVAAAGEATEDAAAAQRQMETTLQAMQRAMEDATAEADRHADAMRDLESVYRADVRKIQSEYLIERITIERDLNREIEGINRDARRARERAIDQHNKSLTRQQAQANDQLAQQQAQHDVQMEFSRRRHYTTMAQSERVYQYDRHRLIAEGDVLALIELDERYALEKQAAEENFRLQQEQAQALFEMQMRQQREAAREQADILRQALTEQLAEIEANRRERVSEAEAEAEEESERLKREATMRRLILDAEHSQDIADEQRKTREINAEIAARFGEMVSQTDLTMQQIDQATLRTFGPGGHWVQAVRDAAAASRTEWISLVAFYNSLMANLPRGGVTPGGRAQYPGRLPVATGRQFGGTAIYSQPTLVPVAERGSEIVTFRPTGGLGGAMDHRHSGTLRVEGSGLDGFDLNALGNMILQQYLRGEIDVQTSIKGQWGS